MGSEMGPLSSPDTTSYRLPQSNYRSTSLNCICCQKPCYIALVQTYLLTYSDGALRVMSFRSVYPAVDPAERPKSALRTGLLQPDVGRVQIRL